jgi:hypothetical protein
MSDHSNLPGPGRGTTCADPETSAARVQDEARTGEARPGRHLRLVEKPPPAEPGAENTPPTRTTHLSRLVEALHASRRIRAAQLARRTLHLVQ